jgi:hypothetical protein
MKSFSIVKTNVGLTSNVKLIVDSKYNLFLDSIESSSELSAAKFKKVQFNKDNYYDELISHFYDGLDSEIAFKVKYDNDNSIMYNTFDKQLDDKYIMGCSNITDNKYYTEDFEYFAPLYISKTNLPKYFAIFRIDGPGINNVNKDNFKSEMLNKFKCVKIVDLTRNTDIGQWLYNNVTNNKVFPLSAFEMDFRDSEFSYWKGIDLTLGGYSQKAYFFDTKLDYENTFNDLEKYIYDGFKTNKLVYPNIINFSFLFDDQPASTTSLRKWSLNRYSGFYLENLELSKSVSTYLPSVLLSGATISSGNIITNNGNTPFSESTMKLDKIWIEYLGNFYPVNKIVTSTTTTWQIISNIDLIGKEAIVNKNIINIDENNKITYINGNSFVIDDWDSADVWLIEIDGKYHNIQIDNNEYYIYTDYGFNISSSELIYYTNYPDPNYRNTVNMLSGIVPKSFPIYKCIFSEIKAFDDSIVDTEFSKFEYEKENDVIQTDETKMYLTDLNSKSNPKSEVDYTINNLTVNIPSASHYTANNETFRIVDNNLNNLWRKNAEYVKWGFKNSISANDYPYLLNNSFIAEDYNKTINAFLTIPSRVDRNLDYFYSINSSTASYQHHSLHIESITNNQINMTYSFNINQYLNLSYDYFNYFFFRKLYLNNSSIIKNVQKFSNFNSGDKSIPNITLFRGLKIKAYDVDTVKILNNELQSINIKTNNTYDDYKFSILLSSNNLTIETDTVDFNKIIVSTSSNTLQWNIIDSWKHEKTYNDNNISNYMDILYIANTASLIIDPNVNPSNSTQWNYFTNSMFWSPTVSYATYSLGNINSIVYNAGEYYFNNGLTTSTFYNPSIIYSYNDIVKYKNKNWISTTGSNNKHPDSNNIWRDSSNLNPTIYWTETDELDYYGDSLTQWTIVQLWDSLSIYNNGATDLVVYNNDLYYATAAIITLGITPDSTTDWTKLYSMIPDTKYTYNTSITNNNVIYLNNRYYLCSSNTASSTLDNGINIFINKKYKNILVNIYINDNTLDNIANADRDVLYKDLYTNLTGFNFINTINDVKNNYGFTNKIKYIIFDDISSKIYDFDQLNSYKNLTSLLTIDGPDQFSSRIMSLSKTPITLNNSQFIAKMSLSNGVIVTKNQINYYNNIHLGNTIDIIKEDPQIIPNYSGLTNKLYNVMYRHSGNYDPIFTTIELFKKGATNSGNYLFDTELTNFGNINQVIISKINRTGNILKLKNSPNLKSIYPMIDEFGYTTSDFFIFKSNWDAAYFKECTPVVIIDVVNIPAPMIAYNNTVNTTVNNYIRSTMLADSPVSYAPVQSTPQILS